VEPFPAERYRSQCALPSHSGSQRRSQRPPRRYHPNPAVTVACRSASAAQSRAHSNRSRMNRRAGCPVFVSARRALPRASPARHALLRSSSDQLARSSRLVPRDEPFLPMIDVKPPAICAKPSGKIAIFRLLPMPLNRLRGVCLGRIGSKLARVLARFLGIVFVVRADPEVPDASIEECPDRQRSARSEIRPASRETQADSAAA